MSIIKQHMLDLAQQQPGFLGSESARQQTNGITLSYWTDLESIRNWKQHNEHLIAQKNGQGIGYNSYHVQICKVERDYYFDDKK